MNECRTVSVSIRQPADRVYAYLAHPPNFPAWSQFIKDMRPDGDAWTATTPEGVVRIRFSQVNSHRILDHWVTVDADLTVYVPMRVLEPQVGSSVVIFTVFRLPDMNDEQFDKDTAMVATDLAGLKRVLESES
ncbi:MAG: hypothetical protein AMXMBFR84_27990 [Candidatus Hydrogenedentota bacterium]